MRLTASVTVFILPTLPYFILIVDLTLQLKSFQFGDAVEAWQPQTTL